LGLRRVTIQMKATEQYFLINFFHWRQELVRNNGRFEKWRVRKSRVKLQSLNEANLRETCHGSKNREVRKIEGSKNRDSTAILDESVK